MKRRLILGLIAAAILLALYWLYSHAYIEITLRENNASANITYVITRVGSNERVEVTTRSSSIKRLLGRGAYEVSVRQQETSYLTTVETGGFLQTQKVQATLSPEKAREFVGNNPNICMYTVFSVVASSPCVGTVDELGIHIPATASRSTYVKNAQGPAALLEDVVSTNQGVFALLSVESEIDGEGNYHALYSVNSGGVFNQASEQRLTDLNGSRIYRLTPYRDGFLAYSLENSELLYYQSFSTKPSELNSERPANAELNLINVSVFGESIVLTYSNQPAADSHHDHAEGITVHSEEVEESRSSVEPKSGIVVYSNNQSKHVSFEEGITAVRLCEAQKLCVVSEDAVLSVYDISGSDPELLYELGSVLDIENTSKGLIVVRNEGAYLFDITKKEGFMEYSFGDYAYCGIEADVSSYVLCVADSTNARYALRINQEASNTDSIDKKIAQLASLAEIKNISVYGRFIYISPDVGDLRPNPQTGNFEYDPTTVEAVNARINQEINKSGISRESYSIISTIR